MIRVGIITDVQYADADPVGNRNYRESIPKFIEAVGAMEKSEVDFILHLGDALNEGWTNLTAAEELFGAVRKPFYNLLGNHDFLVPDEKKSEILKRLRVPEPGYYSFVETDTESGNVWRFILLNGNEISLYAARGGQERARAEEIREKYRLPNGKLSAVWNGAMSERQLAWLDAELIDAEKKGERAIVCNHFPLFSQGDSLDMAAKIPLAKHIPIYFGKLGVSQWNAEELLGLLDRRPKTVRAYCAGHLHEGAYGVRRGVPHITFKGIVQNEPNAWAVMTIQGDEIFFDEFP